MNILDQYSDPIIFAHRGASARAPENSIASFKLALEQHVDAIELDVKLTKDKEIVVIHDSQVDRTTNGKGVVNRLTLDELKRLDAGSSFAPQFAGERIPTLKEVFDLVDKQVLINVEMTNYDSPMDSLPYTVVSLVTSMGMEETVLLSSFNIFNLLITRRLLPQVPQALLAYKGICGWLARSFLGRWITPGIIHPFKTDATEEYIKQQHKIGRRVHAWIVNLPEEMERLYQHGCDGIFTDDPLLARQVFTKCKGNVG